MSVPDMITSLQNAHVKRLVRLRQRRAREDDGVILIEGAREISRALESGLPLLTTYSAPDLHSPDATQLLSRLGTPVALSRAAFEKVSARENPDGLIALAPTPRVTLPEPGAQAVMVVLHGLEKPGNVGAVLRSADAAGAHGVIVLGRGADAYGPNVIRSSQGSVFTLPVTVMDEPEAQAWLSARGFTTFACTPDAPRPYWDAPLTGRVALLLGTEHEGLPAQWRGTDHSLSIPMHGARGADSLNVATAAALMLFECVRQRRAVPA